MKRKIPTLLLVLIIVGFISLLYACRKEFLNNQDVANPDLNDPSIKLNVALAQQYYEELKEKQGNVLTNPGIKVDAAQKPNKKHVSFKKGYSSETSYVSFVEAPLRYDHPVVTFLSDKSTAHQAGKEIIECIFDRLIIYKNKKNGKINQRIVTYIPDKAYLQKHNNDAKHNTITKLDRDFSGFLMYKKWDGTPLYALKIKDGRTVSKIILSNKNKAKTTGTPTTQGVRTLSNCYWFDIETWGYECVTVIYGGGSESKTCHDPYLISTEHVYICDDGTGSGGSEYNGNDGSEAPQPGDGGGGGGSSSGVGAIVTNNLNNPDASCIFNKLQNNSVFNNLLNNFKNSKNLNVNFVMGSPKDSNGSPVGGQTHHYPGTTNFTITIDNGIFGIIGGIEATNTFIHEAFHANLWLKAQEWYPTDLPSNFQNLSLAEQFSYIETRSGSGFIGSNQHNYMASQINLIASGLQAYTQANYPSIYSDPSIAFDSYVAMAYRGLEGTECYTTYVNSLPYGSTSYGNYYGKLLVENKCP